MNTNTPTNPLLLTVTALLSLTLLPLHPASSQEISPAGGGQDFLLESLELQETTIIEAARGISELSGLNVVATAEAGQKEVTLYLQKVRAIDAIEIMARAAGLWYRVSNENGSILILTPEEYQDDLVIRRDEVTRVFTLRHPNALSIAQAIQNVFGRNRVMFQISPFDDDLLFSFGSSQLPNALFNSMGGRGGSGAGGSGGRFGGGGMGMGGMGMGMGGMGMGGNRRGFNPTEMLFGDEPLTPGRISALEDRLNNFAQEDDSTPADSVNEQAVQEITNQQQLIFVALNRTHNLVIVRTSDREAMETIEQLVQEIDRPTPQVLLEMKILEVTIDDEFRSLFDVQFNMGPLGPTVADQTSTNPFLVNAANTAAESVLGAGNFAAEPSTLIYQLLNDNIRARIELYENEGRVDTVATPTLLSTNNRLSTIFVGEEALLTRNVRTITSQVADAGSITNSAAQTETIDVGTTLHLIPKINADRTVTMAIYQESSSIKRGSTTIPVITESGGLEDFPVDTVDRRDITGTVVGQDGHTVAIGGLISESILRQQRKVPVLGDIPVLGRLFRREFDQDTKKELVLLITPHVITTAQEGEMKSLQRVQELSSSLYMKTPPGQPTFESGPSQPWSPQRLQEGYQRTLGEETGLPEALPEAAPEEAPTRTSQKSLTYHIE